MVPLTLKQAAALVPGRDGGDRVSASTVARWIVAGCIARNGDRVRLKAHRAGNRWMIHRADIDNFFAALTGEVQAEESRTPTGRMEASRRAGRELEAIGA